CALLSRQLANKKPDDVFRNYLFLFTLAIVIFALSRSFGHLIKQILLLNDMELTWRRIAPFSGAVNSTTFVVIFAFGIYSHRFQKIHAKVEYYKNNLEKMITVRTEELEKSKNTLENILNNSNPINITAVNFDLLQANDAYYSLWPRTGGETDVIKCYESRPGAHCNTDDCPLKQIVEGREEVSNEVSKNIRGKVREFIVTARPFRDVDGKLIGMVESFQEITLRKQAEKAMRESEERFRQIFESNPDPVILAKQEDGAIIDINKAFETAMGISRSNALGHNSEELEFWADSDTREPFREMLQSHGEFNNYEADFRIKDGQTRTGLVSARLLKVGNEPCVLLVIRDITTEKAAEQALIEMDRIKSEFISTAAHELKTPLSTMMGYTEFLRDPGEFGGFSKEQKHEFINEIYDRGEALCRIIEDLLDISRIESGNPLPLDLQEIDFMEVLSKNVNLFQANNLGHSFHLDLPDTPANSVLLIDRLRINQPLENLLSNAVKYSPEGTEIVLKARAEREGWEVRVEDQGIGMNQEQLDSIFEKFYRADASNTAISGLGLGMSIVKQIIEAHGGSIRVKSTEGKGTTAIFKLPFTV
ncbi:MAG: PAS domain S-box protein, partial [Desulfuromonadales bacterium]|nr:PAS domain S-box protein [Desulfuromonadales bacterium]